MVDKAITNETYDSLTVPRQPRVCCVETVAKSVLRGDGCGSRGPYGLVAGCCFLINEFLSYSVSLVTFVEVGVRRSYLFQRKSFLP